MAAAFEESIMITNRVHIRPEIKVEFADWQAKLNAVIASFPGFVSLEILSPIEPSQPEWTIVQRFQDNTSVSNWRNSQERRALINELKTFLLNGSKGFIEEFESNKLNHQGNVTEVFVTQVSPDKEMAYRDWIARIHQAEAKFPGFRGVYVQSPSQTGGRNWITLLQFDSPENLDRWLTSKERQEVLKESKTLVEALESHRVISGYSGWFASIAATGELPPVWKQTMIVLLVLFPIVMLEMKYLSLLTAGLNGSLGMFIGNAISVSLISWPMMPIAIWFLGWWLSPQKANQAMTTMIGTIVILLLYLIEIAIFWQ